MYLLCVLFRTHSALFSSIPGRLKTVDVIVRSIQGAELLVKGYEIKLSQEEAVPADLSALQSHRAALEVSHDDSSPCTSMVWLH